MSLKESLGSAISHGYLENPERIAALSRAGKLGSLMWRWRYGGQDLALFASNLLTRRAAKRLKIRGYQADYEKLRKLCAQVLREWYSPECQTCLGVKEVAGEHKRIVCEACNGVGIKRYGDYERSEAIGVSLATYKAIWDKRFREVHAMSTAMDAETYLIVREQLQEDDAFIHAEA